jgi:ADP-ribose pyrophosphatase YjhB (NUDIX family)
MAEEYLSPTPVVACAVLYDGHLLLVLRAFDPGAGHWAFPAGYVEVGESAEEAMRRELGEEIGHDLEVSYHGSFGRVLDDGRAFLSLVFVTTAGTTEITLNEESLEHRWVPLTEEALAQVDWAFSSHRLTAHQLARSVD